MSWTTRLLIVANRTAGSAELADALRSRATSSGVRATIVMPAVLGREADASARLAAVVEQLRADGIDAEGVLGDSDPVNAALDVWDPRRFDEIIVCTLPPGESTWLHIDLPHRLRRLTDATVQHLVARPEPAGVSEPR
ncbi:MAG: hypothetical protein QOF12_1727 [Solirubrobacteraceae bacterium]|jgi:hypothetical protein|nr:hypothetical protein [Solirubrobacteraceae bacterium]